MVVYRGSQPLLSATIILNTISLISGQAAGKIDGDFVIIN